MASVQEETNRVAEQKNDLRNIPTYIWESLQKSAGRTWACSAVSVGKPDYLTLETKIKSNLN